MDPSMDDGFDGSGPALIPGLVPFLATFAFMVVRSVLRQPAQTQKSELIVIHARSLRSRQHA